MNRKIKLLISLFIAMIAIVFILKCNSNKVNTAYSYYTDLQKTDSVSSPVVYKKVKSDFINIACSLNKRDFDKLQNMINKYKEEEAIMMKDKKERMDSINKMLK